MFQVLVEKKPANLSELASLLQKDYTMVRTDVKILEGMGIIKLEKLKKNARSGYGGADISYKEVRPIALYKRIVFDFADNCNHRVASATMWIFYNPGSCPP